MRILYFFLLPYLLGQSLTSAGVIWSFAHDLIQWNLVGVPKIHEKTTWDLHPHAGKQNRAVYEQANGKLGEKAIARLGLGYES